MAVPIVRRDGRLSGRERGWPKKSELSNSIANETALAGASTHTMRHPTNDLRFFVFLIGQALWRDSIAEDDNQLARPNGALLTPSLC